MSKNFLMLKQQVYTLHLGTMKPVSQIALSGNYQDVVFILTSVKKDIFISISTAASQEW